jgi:uncharacterized damage-inducible protein DinB
VPSELDVYRQEIEELRGQVRALIAGVPAEALNWRPLPVEGQDEPTNSLAVLAAHVAGSEHYWIAEIVGGRPRTRIRDAEFVTQAADSQELTALLDRSAAETAEILATLDPSALDGEREVPERKVSVRWCLLHVATHTAIHLGHIQLTYQLWLAARASLRRSGTR